APALGAPPLDEPPGFEAPLVPPAPALVAPPASVPAVTAPPVAPAPVPVRPPSGAAPPVPVPAEPPPVLGEGVPATPAPGAVEPPLAVAPPVAAGAPELGCGAGVSELQAQPRSAPKAADRKRVRMTTSRTSTRHR